MKKILLLPFLLGMLISSCSQSEKSVEKPVENGTELSFELAFGDNPNLTKADEEVGTCATTDELISYAAAGTLFANITLVTSTDSVVHTLPITVTTDGRFLTNAMILAPGTYKISQTTVMNGTELLFSAVSATSAYAKYVSKTLPQYFNIGNSSDYTNGYPTIGLYEKGTIDLYLLCVIYETADDFGFVKWDFQFTKLICLPFAVNMNDIYGEDFVGEGTISIKNGVYENGVFTPATEGLIIDEFSSFPQESTGLGRLCFVAYTSDASTEASWYQMTLYTTYPQVKTYVAYVSASTLFDYKGTDNPAWDQNYNFLHIDFSTGNQWVFTTEIQNQPQSWETLDFVNTNSKEEVDPYVSTKTAEASAFSDGFVGVTQNPDKTINIPAGYTIIYKRPITFYESTKKSIIYVDFKAQSEAMTASVFTTYLFVNVNSPIMVPVPNTQDVTTSATSLWTCTDSGFGIITDGSDYSVALHFNQALYNVKDIRISTVNACP